MISLRIGDGLDSYSELALDDKFTVEAIDGLEQIKAYLAKIIFGDVSVPP